MKIVSKNFHVAGKLVSQQKVEEPKSVSWNSVRSTEESVNKKQDSNKPNFQFKNLNLKERAETDIKKTEQTTWRSVVKQPVMEEKIIEKIIEERPKYHEVHHGDLHKLINTKSSYLSDMIHLKE